MDPGPRTLAAAALILAALLAGCDEGRSAYEAGRYEEAHTAFARAVRDAGDDASEELELDLALAALRAGKPEDAEAAATRAEGDARPELRARAEFLRGNAAFARADLAGRQADTPEAEPFAFDIAIRFAEAARDHWIRAATSREDWPEARRNVERALVLLDSLRAKRSQAQSRRVRPPEPNPIPEPGPPPDPPPGTTTKEEEVEAKAARLELTPEQLARIFDRLASKEREKLALRREERKTRMAEVEKDW